MSSHSTTFLNPCEYPKRDIRTIRTDIRLDGFQITLRYLSKPQLAVCCGLVGKLPALKLHLCEVCQYHQSCDQSTDKIQFNMCEVCQYHSYWDRVTATSYYSSWIFSISIFFLTPIQKMASTKIQRPVLTLLSHL